jgi:DNA-binding HxlR family transcriptional regulator
MTEAQWKLVMDQRGVTITNDRFEFRTTGSSQETVGDALDDAALEAALDGAESSQMEAIISELQTMTRRTYGQFCGLSRALEVIGERWSMLIIRDLLVSSLTLNELQKGLPRIPTDLLCTRLKELEHTGIVDKVVLTEPQGSVVYELTDYGRELDRITLQLAAWGARMLGEPRPEDIVTPASVIMAMRSTFQASQAKGLKADYEIHLGELVFHCRIDEGEMVAGEGTLPAPDFVMDPGPYLRPLMAGEVDPHQLISNKAFPFTGNPELLVRFAKVFHIPQSATDHD